MNAKSRALRALANRYAEDLSSRAPLQHHWPDLSLVVKGSTARGNADRYSDIDFVFYCDEGVRSAIVSAYRDLGLTDRSDGVFLPLGDWDGHYHFETFAHLRDVFAQRDIPQAWEVGGAVALHDPGDRFRLLVKGLMDEMLADTLPLLRAAYLDLKLTLDWLRHPLKRADTVASALHAAKLLQGLCRIAYLLDGKPYPHDKWLFHYLTGTRFGRNHRPGLLAYAGLLGAPAHPGGELGDYPQYAEAAALTDQIAAAIRRDHGHQPWLDEWWRYV